MCCLFGLMDRSHSFNGRERGIMLNHLARASEARGTDATGIAFINRGHMKVYKRPMAAHMLRLRIPEDATTVIGHTRLTTQGNQKYNPNNHPWCSSVCKDTFALAHNGVLHNDLWLRKSLNLPTTKVETDSYIAVQLIEHRRGLSFDSLRYMAEKVEGSFAFSILDQKNQIYLVKGDNPIYLLHFPVYDLYVYASTAGILTDALVRMPFNFGKPEEIPLTCGDILCLSPTEEPKRETFDNKYFDYGCWGRYYSMPRLYHTPSSQPTYSCSSFETDYIEDLKTVASAYGFTPETIDELLDSGCTPEELEDLLYCYTEV